MRYSTDNFELESEDLKQISAHGKTIEQVTEELGTVGRGLPRVKLSRACTIGDGIVRLSPSEPLIRSFETERARGRASKFVAASGAATRMFDAQRAVLESAWSRRELLEEASRGNRKAGECLRLIDNLPRFAFYDELSKKLAEHGLDVESLRRRGRFRQILRFLLGPEGLNYGRLPKGLVLYHRYPDGPRTAFDEHLVESEGYLGDADGRVRIHFTVTPEYAALVQRRLDAAGRRFGGPAARFDITVSQQKRSTDVIAVDSQNRPFRDANGQLVFRPGGHGVLLENLNALAGDIVFVRTVDNVLPDSRKVEVCRYKQMLGGLLVTVQHELFTHVARLNEPVVGREALTSAERFLEERLPGSLPRYQAGGSPRRRRLALLRRLNRPLRVCGMVRHEGEPGGGPFWVERQDGEVSLQIVESSQLDRDSPEQLEIFESCRFFNPADLVCGLRDYRGRPFNLPEFRDPRAGFIVRKQRMGRELKALEHPGLWNGSMADWNTIFVEIPRTTFHPVKNVLDLLDHAHAVTS